MALRQGTGLAQDWLAGVTIASGTAEEARLREVHWLRPAVRNEWTRALEVAAPTLL